MLFNIFELLTRYQVKNQFGTTHFSGLFVRSYEPGTRLHLSNQINREQLFFEFCFQVFCQSGPPQQVLTAWSKWELSVKNLSKDTTMHYYWLENRTTVSNLSQRSTTTYRHRFFQVKIYYDCSFLSFKCLRCKISQRIIRNKNPFSHFFAF